MMRLLSSCFMRANHMQVSAWDNSWKTSGVRCLVVEHMQASASLL